MKERVEGKVQYLWTDCENDRIDESIVAVNLRDTPEEAKLARARYRDSPNFNMVLFIDGKYAWVVEPKKNRLGL